MSFMGDLPRVTVIGTEHALRAVKFVDQRCQRVEIAGCGPFTDHQRHAELQFPASFFQLITFVAVFNTRSNIGVKFFTTQTRAVTVQRQVAKCIQFIEQRILPANYARVVHHFCKAGNLRMVPPGEHLFKGKTGTVNIAAFQGGYARADL